MNNLENYQNKLQECKEAFQSGTITFSEFRKKTHDIVKYMKPLFSTFKTN